DTPRRPETLDDVLGPALAAVNDLLDGAELSGVVLGVPAPFRPGAGLPPIPQLADQGWRYPAWLTPDPSEAIEQRAGTRAMTESAANLAALGELHAGAGRGIDTSVYVKLGARSVGTGLIIGGRLHRGVSGFAGELAHVQVREDGPLCGCGGR